MLWRTVLVIFTVLLSTLLTVADDGVETATLSTAEVNTHDSLEGATADVDEENLSPNETSEEVLTEERESAQEEEKEDSEVCEVDDDGKSTASNEEAGAATEGAATEQNSKEEGSENVTRIPNQSGPLIDLLGPVLLKLEMVDETQAMLVPLPTNEALSGKKVIGLFFAADWCGPCQKFTPQLVKLYERINARRGTAKDSFEVVWISRSRDFNSYGQYLVKMPWLALSLEDASGQRGQALSSKYKVKGIPTLVLVDDMGALITADGRDRVAKDRSGVGFPWRHPLATAYMTIVPKSLRMMIRYQLQQLTLRVVKTVKGVVKPSAKEAEKVNQ